MIGDFRLHIVLLLLLLSTRYLSSTADVHDHHSFISRYYARKEYTNAIHALPVDPALAIKYLTESFRIVPTCAVAELLAYIFRFFFHNENEAEKWMILAASVNQNHQVHSNILKLALQEYSAGNYVQSLYWLDDILSSNAWNVQALFQKAITLQHIGSIQLSADTYYTILEHNPIHDQSLLNLGALHQGFGDVTNALPFYYRAVHACETALVLNPLTVSPIYIKTRVNIALALYQLKWLEKARIEANGLLRQIKEYQRMKDCSSKVISSQFAPNVEDSCSYLHGEEMASLSTVAHIHRAMAYWDMWEYNYEALLEETLRNVADYVVHIKSNFSEGQIPPLGPLLPFDILMLPVSNNIRLKIAATHSLSYAPRGTAVSKFPNDIERATSVDGNTIQASSLPQSISLATRNSSDQKVTLRLGFISFDFSDHPTAYMIESIFQVVRKNRRLVSTEFSGPTAYQNDVFRGVELFIFDYGKNDESPVRKRLKELADSFVDISTASHSDAAAIIERACVDVLLDLQLHTLGGRMQILALRPAPLQVSYLVYPGTSGASFIDAIVGDVVVTPAEHALHYSEAVLLLPGTYQISHYAESNSETLLSRRIGDATSVEDTQDEQRALNNVCDVQSNFRNDSLCRLKLRSLYGLPTGNSAIIFCNFNKLEKLDPESFMLWLRVMLRQPQSYLWLLSPSSSSSSSSHHGAADTASAAANERSRHQLGPQDVDRPPPQEEAMAPGLETTSLLEFAEMQGVLRSRIFFAPRVNKQEHILRHKAADLFLDTLEYSAHSTATDALRGGLPVLTLEGGSFPNRVVSSLYAAFDDDIDASFHREEASETAPGTMRRKMSMSHSKSSRFLFRDWLVVYSKRAFEDAALQLVHRGGSENYAKQIFSSGFDTQSFSLIALAKQNLENAVKHSTGPFNADRNVCRFIRGMAALADASRLHLDKDTTKTHNWTKPLLEAIEGALHHRRLPNILMVEPHMV